MKTMVLKPCPNCGSSNGHAVGRMRIGDRFTGKTEYFVRCDDCKFIVRGYVSEVESIRKWNWLADTASEKEK